VATPDAAAGNTLRRPSIAFVPDLDTRRRCTPGIGSQQERAWDHDSENVRLRDRFAPRAGGGQPAFAQDPP
jgi:hypothetical protein